MTKITKILMLLAAVVGLSYGQTTTTQTTFSATVSAPTGTSSPTQQVCLTSATNVSAPQFGNGSNSITYLVADKEVMYVNAATPVSTCFIVTRGWNGSVPTPHTTSAVVWVGYSGGFLSSPFIGNPHVPGTTCSATSEPYLPQIVIGSPNSPVFSETGNVYNCPTTGVNANVWTVLRLPMAGNNSTGYIYTDGNGANTALTVSYPGLPLVKGACLALKLGYTLQAGANTIALNGGSAKSILSHFNTSNNIGTAYAATGVWFGCYDGTEWMDSSE